MIDQPYIDHPLLAIYPNVRGFGYAFFPEHKVLKEAGTATIALRKEERYIERILGMIDVYKPTVILLPTSDGKFNRKRERIRLLLIKIRSIAKANDIVIKAYSREEIRLVFEEFQAYSKVQIAQALNRWFPDIAKRCSQERKQYMAEDYYQGVYDAVSLVMTYYSQ